jgi:methionine-gamma-lyase
MAWMSETRKFSEVIQALRDVQHFGEEGGVVPVVDVAATSTFLKPGDMTKAFHGEMAGCYLYSRHSNPTVMMFGKKFAAMEGMEAALGVASGMAAISAAIEQLMPEGGHLVCSRTIYGGTYALFQNLLPRRGIQVTFVDPNDLGAFEKAITPQTRVIYTETMSNPLLGVSHLAGLGQLSRARGLKLVVDNTFAPLMIAPGEFGADVVVYSCTKYISGASDLIAGVIVGKQDFINQLIDLNHGVVMLSGPVMDPRVAHELYLRLDHLPLRMAAHSHSAMVLARKLHAAEVPVIYPGLENHPQHALMKTMMRPEMGFGGMLTVDCGTTDKAMALAAALQDEKFGLYAVSLGFSRTLMSCPSVSTSSEIPADEQLEMKLSPGLLRLSIGYTGDDAIMAERFLSCYRKLR